MPNVDAVGEVGDFPTNLWKRNCRGDDRRNQDRKSTATIQFDDLSMADCASVKLRDKVDSEFRQPFRQWSSASGTFHVNAKAVAYIDDKNVRLTKEDGKVTSVPVDKLSKADQSYLDRLKNAIKTVAVAADDPFASTQSFNGSPDTTATDTVKKPVAHTSAKPIQSDGLDDRNPNGEQATGQTATGIPTYTGPRGGVYHYSPSGNKVYSKHK